MLIDRFAVLAVHWTARTFVSLLGAPRRTGPSLELASPQGELLEGPEDEEVLNIRAPDRDLLSTLEETGSEES